MAARPLNDPHTTLMDCASKKDHYADIGREEDGVKSYSLSQVVSNPMRITFLCNPTNVEVTRKGDIPSEEGPMHTLSPVGRAASVSALISMEISVNPISMIVPSATFFGVHPRAMTSSFPADAGCVRRCTRCGTGSTPSWRRSPEGYLLCNACGLYEKINLRPRKFRIGADGNLRVRRISTPDASGRRCTNCRTDRTPMWRRLQGAYYCNACAIYYRTNGCHRPAVHRCGSINSPARP